MNDAVEKPYRREFHTAGNYDVVGGFKITGHMPNLEAHLKKNGLTPQEYFEVKAQIAGDDKNGIYLRELGEKFVELIVHITDDIHQTEHWFRSQLYRRHWDQLEATPERLMLVEG